MNTRPENDVARLADRFVGVIREWATPEEFAEICRKNATADYAGQICATHDVMDANEAMLEAFRQTFDREPAFLDNPNEDADMALWSAAWAQAKAEKLTSARDDA